jgi:hypothetical protein
MSLPRLRKSLVREAKGGSRGRVSALYVTSLVLLKEPARIQLPPALRSRGTGKLREARDLYVSVHNDAPDPKVVDRRLKTLDSKLDALEKSAR